MKDLFFVGRLRLPGHNPPLVPVYEHAAAAAVCVAHVEVILVAAAGLALAQNLDTEYQILALKYLETIIVKAMSQFKEVL